MIFPHKAQKKRDAQFLLYTANNLSDPSVTLLLAPSYLMLPCN